jgi:hypothetical protein
MLLTERRVRDLVTQWSVRASPGAEDVLSEDFVYLSEGAVNGILAAPSQVRRGLIE